MVGQNGRCAGKVWAGMPVECRMHYDHRSNENNSKKMLEMFLALPPLETVLEAVVLATAYLLPRPNLRTLEKGYTQIWIKVEKVDSKFKMKKDRTTLRYAFGMKYQIVVLTGERVGENWPTG